MPFNPCRHSTRVLNVYSPSVRSGTCATDLWKTTVVRQPDTGRGRTHRIHDRLFYFPAYELVIDDLRDYRFYAEDMVHPNYAATNYVWEKFLEACVDEADRKLMKEIADIRSAANHKPFHPTSNAHRAFLASSRDKLIKLKEQYPYIDFEEELAIFDKQAT